jgi:hypothetical protein
MDQTEPAAPHSDPQHDKRKQPTDAADVGDVLEAVGDVIEVSSSCGDASCDLPACDLPCDPGCF